MSNTNDVSSDLIRQGLLYAADIIADIQADTSGPLRQYWQQFGGPGDSWDHVVDKITAEMALLVLLAHRSRQLDHGDALWLEAIERVYSFINEQIALPRHIAILTRHPQAVAGLMLAPAVLNTVGHYRRHDDYLEMLKHLSTVSQFELSERLPFREMERRWTVSLLTGKQPDFEDLIPLSIVRVSRHPALMCDNEAYAYTHAIMFLTDFGERVEPRLDYALVREVTNASIAHYMAVFNLDLLSEMLIVAYCVGAGDSAIVKAAQALIRQIWSELDFVPGPNFDPDTYITLDEASRRAYCIGRCYHTTFVASLLASVHWQCANSPPRRHDSEEYFTLNIVGQRVRRLIKSILPINDNGPQIRNAVQDECATRLRTLVSTRGIDIVSQTVAPQQHGEVFADLALAKVAALGDLATIVRCCDNAFVCLSRPTFMLLTTMEMVLEKLALVRKASTLCVGDEMFNETDAAIIADRWNVFLTQCEM